MWNDTKTRESLLARLKNEAGDADWQVFYRQYAVLILAFCNHRGIDPSEAWDVLQETMMLVLRKLPGFQYDPALGRFRNWLRTLVDGKIRDAIRRNRRARCLSLDDERAVVPEVEALISSEPETSASVEKSWRLALIKEALWRMENDPRVKPRTFGAFLAYAIEGKPASEVAERFGMKENALYRLKDRCIERLEREIQSLENPNLGTS